MNTDKYIEQYLDEILENPNFLLENDINTINSLNEDDCQDDITSELYQNMYENKLNSDKSKQKVNFNLDNNNIFEFDNIDDNDNDKKNLIDLDIEIGYYLNLINVFMLYYNEKFEKSENFFSGVQNVDMDTSNQMELFFEAIIEFKNLKNKISKDIELNDKNDVILENEESLNNITMKFIFNETQEDKIKYLFDLWEGQIYCLNISSEKFFTPSLIVCLNYIQTNNLEFGTYNIFNLRNY